jgi:hypothetical protein
VTERDAGGWRIDDMSYTRPRDGLVHDVMQYYDDAYPEIRLRCGLSPNDEPDEERKPTTCFACLRMRP